MDLPKRKKIRLSEYDYSQSGVYFVTICVKKEKCNLWNTKINFHQIVGADIIRPYEQNYFEYKLSKYGEIVKSAIENINTHYPNIIVDKYSIMPDHLHIILFIEQIDGRQIAAPTLSTVVGQMKRWVSKRIGFSIWQKSFYEKIIRNEKAYREIWKYVDNNPLKFLYKTNNLDEYL